MTNISSSIQKDIERFSNLSIDDLGKHISSQMPPNKGEQLFQVLNFLFSSPPAKVKDRYPKIYQGKSLYTKYIADVQSALCKHDWLCEKLKNREQLSYDEMIFHIAEAISTNDDLDNWSLHPLNPIPVAILITKIGSLRFCGCP